MSSLSLISSLGLLINSGNYYTNKPHFVFFYCVLLIYMFSSGLKCHFKVCVLALLKFGSDLGPYLIHGYSLNHCTV